MEFLVFGDLLFQPYIFWYYLIISKSVKYVALLHIMTYIKESIITKLQKLYSPPRNLRAGNKSPTLFLKKRSCTGDLSPPNKIFVERPDKIISISTMLYFFKKKIKKSTCRYHYQNLDDMIYSS